jgi:hypothetical protein
MSMLDREIIMTNETVVSDNQQSNQWKQVFETALDELGGQSDAASLARNMPIANRIRIARPPADPATAQKRALTDAATALAALWNRPAPRHGSPMRIRDDRRFLK